MPDRLRLCFVSMHTSPANLPGSGDAGGMNVVERSQALALAGLGHSVDLVTRRSHPDDPDAVELAPGVVLRHLDAGPRTPLPKSVIDDHIDEFSAGLATLGDYDLFHSHHWMSGVAALPVAAARGVPHVQSYHSVAALPGSPLSSGEVPESVRRVSGEALVAPFRRPRRTRSSSAVVPIPTGSRSSPRASTGSCSVPSLPVRTPGRRRSRPRTATSCSPPGCSR